MACYGHPQHRLRGVAGMHGKSPILSFLLLFLSEGHLGQLKSECDGLLWLCLRRDGAFLLKGEFLDKKGYFLGKKEFTRFRIREIKVLGETRFFMSESN